MVLIVAVGEKDGQRLRFVAQETVAARAERRELTMEGDGRETGGRREEERGGKGGEGTNRKAEKDREGLWGSNDGQCVLLERVCVWYVLWCAGRAWRGVRWRARWIFRHVPTGIDMQQEAASLSPTNRAAGQGVCAGCCRSDRRQRADRAPRMRCGFPFQCAQSLHDRFFIHFHFHTLTS